MRLMLLLSAFAMAQAAPPAIPAGLWQNQSEGFVIRIEPCGEGFCGIAAGAPKDKKQKPQDVCGKKMLNDFVWNEKSRRWEGRMQPPGTEMKLNTTIVSDGKSFLTMKGKVLLLSKTMHFVPFNGRIGEGCRLD